LVTSKISYLQLLSILTLPVSSIPPVDVAPSELLEVRASVGVVEVDLGAASLPLDFSRRAPLEELMDRPCSYEELRACLHDIARVNRLTFAHRPTLSWLNKVIASRPAGDGPLRVVDVGCGYGDTLRMVDAWAAKRGVAVRLTGIDLNENAIRAAREATPSWQRIEWVVGDALHQDAMGDADVIMCTLLTHHLDDVQVVRFLRWMEETAQCGWFINDLHRRSVPYHLFRLWARFANWHRFVKHDGPVSIRRSFVAEDWEGLCVAAGVCAETVSIREYRPARLCVGRIR
jgi:2-polyprenyl-3-methyl-5-hydroxy-6-metoxy-1,4-benzoquinol methylase